MRLALLAAMSGLLPTALLASLEGDGAVALVAAVLGGGGLFGVVRVWLAAQARREERADERFAAVLAAAREEREKDRAEERAERDRTTTRFDAALQRVEGSFASSSSRTVDAVDALAREVRGLREDQRAGLACRMADVPRTESVEARPIGKVDGTRGG